MKNVVQRRGIYWFRGRINGILVQQSLGTRDEVEAIKAARSLLLDMPQPGEVEAPYQAAMEAYLSFKKTECHNARTFLRHQRLIIGNLARDNGWQSVRDATRADIERWLAGMGNPRSRIEYLKVLTVFFKWLVAKKKLGANPCDGIDRPRRIPKSVRRRFLTPEESERVLSTPCGDDLKFALFAMLHAGLRIGEVCAARPSWFDLDAGLLHLAADDGWKAKDGENRTIPLTARFIEFLREYGLREPYMLRPSKKQGKGFYRVFIRREFDAHMKACNVTGVTFHDLRRTFASLHVSAGTSVYIVAQWCGDAVDIIQRHYGHLHHANRGDIERAWK
jgi:integrase